MGSYFLWSSFTTILTASSGCCSCWELIEPGPCNKSLWNGWKEKRLRLRRKIFQGKVGRKGKGWDNGGKEMRMWEPGQPNGENKNTEEEGEARSKGLACVEGGWIRQITWKERRTLLSHLSILIVSLGLFCCYILMGFGSISLCHCISGTVQMAKKKK